MRFAHEPSCVRSVLTPMRNEAVVSELGGRNNSLTWDLGLEIHLPVLDHLTPALSLSGSVSPARRRGCAGRPRARRLGGIGRARRLAQLV